MKRRIWTWGAVLWLAVVLAGCVPERPYVDKEKLPIEPVGVEESVVEENTRVIIYAVHPDGLTGDMLDLLTAHPQLRLTLCFPTGYFESDERREHLPRFQTLVSSNQIEVALTLEHNPNLALLGDIRLAKGAANWDFDFSRPEDIAAHIARGSARYQQTWNRLPSGLLPPYFALSDPAVRALRKFRLNWVVGKPSANPGLVLTGPTTLMNPPLQPVPTQWTQGSELWSNHLAEWALAHAFCFIDGAKWDNPRSELAFLSELARQTRDSPYTLQTATEWTERVDSSLERKDFNLSSQEYEDWAKTSQQKYAWRAIADAREALEKYKNSGRANLRLLDSAMEEILTAEGGDFLLALGQTHVPLTVNKRNFIATLSNVYRLAGLSIPPHLPQLFSGNGKSREVSDSRTDGSFFEAVSDTRLKWNDPQDDDDGGGHIAYPTGPYNAGDFDIRQFSIDWSDSTVTFSVQMQALANTTQAAVLPLIDVYIDINRISNAGSTSPLVQRGPVVIHRDAAWEYALSFGPDVAVLYQSVIGDTAREVKKFKPRVNDRYHSISVSLPRTNITQRNEPSDWRMTVALSGSENSPAGQLARPVPILIAPGIKNFGGSATGRTAPAFVDLVAASVQDQKSELSRYLSGRNGTLPYIEAE